MFDLFEIFKKRKQSEAVPVPAKEEKIVPPCSVTLVRRIDFLEESDSKGDEYCNSSYRDRDALDIVQYQGAYYAVHTKTHYSESYDRYESPMNTSSENCSIEIVPIGADLLEADREAVLAYMKPCSSIWGRHDYATHPSTDFVCRQVEKALLRQEKEAALARKKEKCEPNALRISYSGVATPFYIDDFSPEGLAEAWDCDSVSIYKETDLPGVAVFYNTKVVYGLPYNHVASAVLGKCLEGAVAICGVRDGQCCGLTFEQVKKLKKHFRQK